MDPLTGLAAVGTAANIIQIIQVGVQLCNRLRMFAATQAELPETLGHTHERLGLLVKSLEQLDLAESDEKDPRLQDFLSGLQSRILKLTEIITKYLPASEDTIAAKVRKALESLGKDADVENISNELQNDVIHLNLFLHTRKGPVYGQHSLTPDVEHLRGRRFFEVSYRNISDFVGRQDSLLMLQEAFEVGDEGTKTVVLQGMGGQGKTQIALRYCHDAWATGRFRSVFWVNASSEVSVLQGFSDISDLLKVPDQVLLDSQSRVRLVRRNLSYWEEPWLLVLDNYDDPQHFQNLRSYFPVLSKGRILITTRDLDTWRLGRTVHITGMSEVEGLQLLFKNSGIPNNESSVEPARKLLNRLGYLPLAIDQAAAYLRDRAGELDLESFLEHFEDNSKQVLASAPAVWEYLEQTSTQQEEIAKTVFTTWEMSLSRLEPTTEVGRKKLSFLSVLGFFNPDGISERLFCTFYNAVPDTSRHPEWMSLFSYPASKWSQDKFRALIRTLKKLSLITDVVAPENKELQIILHPLVSDWLRLRVTDESTRAQCFRDYSTILAENMMQFGLETNLIGFTFKMPRQTRNMFLSHLNNYEGRLRQYLPWPAEPTVLATRVRDIAWAEQCFVLLFDYSHGFGQGITTADWCFKAAQSASVLDSKAHLAVGVNLVNQIHADGNWQEAVTVAEVQRDYWMRKKGECSFECLRSQTLACWMAARFGDIERIVESLRDALAKWDTIIASDDEQMHRLRSAIVVSLADGIAMMNQTEEASGMIEELCQSGRKTANICEGSVSWTWGTWDVVQRNISDSEMRERLVREWLSMTEQELGREHFYFFWTQNTLAMVLNDSGRSQEAEKIIKKCIEDTKDVAPRYSSDLWMLDTLFSCLVDQNKFDEALQVQRQGAALSQYRDVILRLRWEGNFALLLCYQKEYVTAERQTRACIETWKHGPSDAGYEFSLEGFRLFYLLTKISRDQQKVVDEIEVIREVLQLMDQGKISGRDRKGWELTLAKLLECQNDASEAEDEAIHSTSSPPTERKSDRLRRTFASTTWSHMFRRQPVDVSQGIIRSSQLKTEGSPSAVRSVFSRLKSG